MSVQLLLAHKNTFSSLVKILKPLSRYPNRYTGGRTHFSGIPSVTESTACKPFRSKRIPFAKLTEEFSARKSLLSFNLFPVASAHHTHRSFVSVSTDHEMSGMKIAVAQMTAVGDIEANFSVCEDLAQQAAKAGCAMLFLPECFNYIGMSVTDGLSVAEPLDGPTVKRYSQLAQDTGLWLSLGGFQEVGPDSGHRYNCHLVLSAQGELMAAYRKIHLFDLSLPDASPPVSLLESAGTAPGWEAVACDSPVGRLGVTVCYDLRFPELYQKLRFEMGAEVLLVPSAFTRPTGEAHWEVLLRARAIETQCFVVAAAQAGRHNEKRESYGHALVIDPWGKVIGKLDDPEATGIAVATIDLEQLKGVRTKMPIESHRRYDVYGPNPDHGS